MNNRDPIIQLPTPIQYIFDGQLEDVLGTFQVSRKVIFYNVF